MLSKFLCFCILLLSSQYCWAQGVRIWRDDIRTLRCDVEGRLEALPTISLGGTEQVKVSFDQMSHDGKRFFYRVEHCTKDWKKTDELFPNEYLEGNQEENRIEDHRESRNTTTLYTHYSFLFPNAEIRPAISGNYRLTLYEEKTDEQKPVAQVCIAVVENEMSITGKVSTNTDMDWNRHHQQLDLQINALRSPRGDLRTAVTVVVRQNGREDNAVTLPSPTYASVDRLLWTHCRALIFPAGNEYRRFEWLSTGGSGLYIDKVRWAAPYYHITLATDEFRHNYLVREDRDGTAVIRNTDNSDADAESDYGFVQFTLEGEEIPNADLYISGRWNAEKFSPEYRLTYNALRQAYEAALFIKQGYYEYLYLTVLQGDSIGETAPTEGDFYPTTNEYTVWVYCRFPSDRYDRLTGFATLRN